jgi:hypothetical protein
LAIVDGGRIVATGAPAELKAGLRGDLARPSLEDVYLAATGHAYLQDA